MTTQKSTSGGIESVGQWSALQNATDIVAADLPRDQVDLQPIQEYAELKRLITQHGLLNKQLGYYAY